MKGITNHCYTQNIKALGLMVSEKIFFNFLYCKSMGANDPRGAANLDPKSMIGRIYVDTTKHCYILNIQAYGLMVSEKNIFSSFSHYRPMADNDTPWAWPL